MLHHLKDSQFVLFMNTYRKNMMVRKVAFGIVNHGQRVVSLQEELQKAPSYIWEDSAYHGIGHCNN